MRIDDALAQLQAAANANAARGSLLFHLDLATALGREAMRAAGLGGDMTATIVDGGGYGVFAIEEGAVPRLRGEVRFAADGRPIVSARNAEPTQPVVALARAARTVSDARLVEAAREAIIVIPRRADAGAEEPIEVYALALPGRPGDIVFGIHHHATVSADGASLRGTTPLSRTAFSLSSDGDHPPLGVEVTHFGATPSEIHAYLSLKHSMPLRVAALESGLLWAVDGERVRAEGPIPA